MLKKEFIGKNLEIKKTDNKQQINIKGKILLETKNTFIILQENKEKTIQKKNKTFIINNEEIQGNTILKKPEERIKIKRKN